MMQPDDPPYLAVGTEVSAKYKGAFCEAKVNKVVKNVKVKVTFKLPGLGSQVLSDENVKGVLKVGEQVKAFHIDRGQYVDACVNKIQDCSQYTVVFDDGDITSLRRNSLCLKSGRHFAESETLDQLPLTHPEHFGTPVVGGRRGRRSRPNQERDSDDDSSSDDENVCKKQRARRCEWEGDIGKVVCVETGEKKKQKDNWFPGLLVAPTAQATVKIDTKKDFLVRSFQDGRYYTVPKKETQMFSHENAARISQGSLRAAVDKALEFIDDGILPLHWDRDLLLGHKSRVPSDKSSMSNTSDDEPREEKDHFVAQLYKYMEECNTPLNKEPTIGNKELDLYKLYKVVTKLGGYNRVMNQNQWKVVANKMSFQQLGSQAANLTKAAYKRYLQTFEGFYRKLGCTMVSSPRGSRMRHRSGRSLIRDCDKTPRPAKKGTESGDSTEEESDKKEDVKGATSSDTEKKEEPRCSRSMTPLQNVTLLKEKPKIQKHEPKKVVKAKEEILPKVKVEKKTEESDSEEDIVPHSTRSLRNREDTKEDAKKVVKRRENQRSASCTSTSSAASSSSKDFEWNKCAEKRFKTRGSSVPVTEKIKPCKLECVEEKVKKIEEKKASSDDGKRNGIEERKRGRKKKTGPLEDQGKFLLPASIGVNIGDKLRVLYGPDYKESKVTYDAKVLKIDEGRAKKIYFVHYLGWNIRYDEWIDRSRISQNLTWKANRSRKNLLNNLQNKKIKQEKPEKDATSRPPIHGLRGRSSSTIKDEDECKDADISDPVKPQEVPELRETTDSDGIESGGESCSDPAMSDSTSEKASDIGSTPDTIKIEKVSCGKDIDLKAIESEMKGLDKPVKKEKPGIMTTVIPGSLTIVEKKSSDPKKPNDSPLKKVEIPVRLVPAHEVMGQIKPMPVVVKESILDDDIYEFREPEPFDISEMRSRKDTRLPGEQDDESIKIEPDLEDSDSEFNVKKESKDYSRKSDPSKKSVCKSPELSDIQGGTHSVEIHNTMHSIQDPSLGPPPECKMETVSICKPVADYSESIKSSHVLAHVVPDRSKKCVPKVPPKKEVDPKVMPFSQRQQHIFPHLLSLPEVSEEKKESPRSPWAPDPVVDEVKDESTVTDKKCETSVEESIEAVVQRARQDLASDKAPLRLLEKRRKNIGRLKKLSREMVDSSDESDCAIDDTPRQKRKSHDGSKYSPKRFQRLSTDAEKKFAQQCEEEERANDADEEDNEPLPPRTSLRRRIDDDDDARSKHPKKRRRSVKHQDDNDETGFGDLLCEETFIPGSPMTEMTEVAVSKQEMPFASVPTGSSFGKKSVFESTETPIEVPLDAPVQTKEPDNKIHVINGKPTVAGRTLQPVTMVNTPPSTPDSSATNTSDSPLRDDHVKQDDTSKSGQYSSEVDFDSKTDLLSEDSNTMDSSKPIIRPFSSGARKSEEGWDTEDGSLENIPPTKPLKMAPEVSFVSPTPKRKVFAMNKVNAPEPPNARMPSRDQGVIHPPEFYVLVPEFRHEMCGEERIALIEEALKEERRKYLKLKAELASIDRRIKKNRKKNKEKEAARRDA